MQSIWKCLLMPVGLYRIRALNRAVSCAVVQGSVGEVGKEEGVAGRETAWPRFRMLRGVASADAEGASEGAGEDAEVAVVRARFLGGIM